MRYLLFFAFIVLQLSTAQSNDVIVAYSGIESETGSVRYWSFPRSVVVANGGTWPEVADAEFGDLLEIAKLSVSNEAFGKYAEVRPTSPFGSDAIEPSKLDWELRRIELSPIDLGRTREASLEWSQNISDVVIVTFIFVAKEGAVEGRVFLLSNGDVAKQKVSKPTAEELREFRYRQKEVHRPVP